LYCDDEGFKVYGKYYCGELLENTVYTSENCCLSDWVYTTSCSCDTYTRYAVQYYCGERTSAKTVSCTPTGCPTATPAPTPSTPLCSPIDKTICSTNNIKPGACTEPWTNTQCPYIGTQQGTCVPSSDPDCLAPLTVNGGYPSNCFCTTSEDVAEEYCYEYGDCIYSSDLDGCYQNWECDVDGQIYEQIRQCAGTGTVDGQVCVPVDTGGDTTPTCSVSLSPASSLVGYGQSVFLNSDVTIDYGTVSYVAFSALPGSIVTLDPGEDALPPYGTNATGFGMGTTTVTASVYMDGSVRCSDTATISVTSGPWWQVKDSDVTTSGNIVSSVPSGLYFGLPGLGGYPGVAVYGGVINKGSGEISSTGWNANTTSESSRVYDYSYFLRQLPQEVIDGATVVPSVITSSTFASEGYLYQGIYFYQFASSGEDITFSQDIDLGARKVALLTKGADIYLNGKINLTDGVGFIALLAGKDDNGNKGNIYINPAVSGATASFEGIYLADGTIYTGTNGADLDGQLITRGSVAGITGISLQRDLADDSATPAELFEYAPDQIMILLNSPAFGAKKMSWKEVAP
jgi:hypothetical protein